MKNFLSPLLVVVCVLTQVFTVHAAVISTESSSDSCSTGSSSIDTGAILSADGGCLGSTTETGSLSFESIRKRHATDPSEDSLSLNSASILDPVSVPSNITYTPWELMHRGPMVAGFVWTGVISNYITPAMYFGTPFVGNTGYIGNPNPTNTYLEGKSHTYAECITHESYISFGLGESIEDTDIREYKAIAKACAEEFYGSYFEGKGYTTREEFLMMLFTMFGEKNVGFHGNFTADGSYVENTSDTFITGYANISASAWYASYLKLARYMGLVDTTETKWQVGKLVSDREAIDMLSSYVAARMNFQGQSLEAGSILNDGIQYNFIFPSSNEVLIRIQ